MSSKTYSSFRTSTSEIGGGRVAILLLLFALALYQFYSAGFGAFAAVCMLPAVIIAVVVTAKTKMGVFWILVVVNYFIQMKNAILIPGFPMSLYNEALEILLLLSAAINVKESKFDSIYNVMLGALIVWCSFCTLELFNNSCGLGLQVGFWFTGARLMCFQLLYAFLVFAIYINTPKNLQKYLILWGGLALFSVFWIYKQKYIGLTENEDWWLHGPGSKTHIINAGTTIRYFSTFSDAASAGINLASTAVAFIIFGLTSKIKKYKYLFLIIGLGCVWATFPTGTRTAIFCMFAGFAAYTVLSKSIKLTAFIATVGVLFFFMLAFTNIGDSNASIRRMRSAFDKNDASAGARTANKAVIKKYLADAPFGIGIGINNGDLPPNNKYHKLSMVPPDSEYVYIWVHTGIIGIIIFVLTTAIMFIGGSWIVMFKLKSPSLRGIGGGLCCAFISMQLGGYANQVLMQFPNALIFYGGLAIVYTLPFYEKEWMEYETKLLEEQTEKERLKLEAKKAKRV